MAKNVLILGSGLVSQPIIDYLFANTNYQLTVADILIENARKAIQDNPRGVASSLDVNNTEQLEQLIANADLVVSLLPYVLHGLVAQHCLRLEKSMVNASYVSDEMRAFDSEAKEKGLLFLCEMGLDPGLDHMSAMQIIHDVQSRGGKITDFVSVCGGLPAPESNTNPFGYKFSWSPKGVLLAGKNSARYINGGGVTEISAENLFRSTKPMEIDGHEFEAYPNRDSVSYEEIYGLKDIKHLMRGTLRYAGWHKIMLALKALNLLDDTPIKAECTSFAEVIADLNDLNPDDILIKVADKLDLDPEDKVIKALDWLGLFGTETQDFAGSTIIDALANLMKDKMAYLPNERDMVALQHRFKASFEDHVEDITSTLFDYGIPGGDSSMARTVSLPLAIAVKLILEGKIDLTGVQIPVDPIIYEPVLNELKASGIAFEEKVLIS